MAIKIISGQVDNGSKKFVKDDILTGLSKQDETRLVFLGFAELLPEEKKSQEVNPYVGKSAEEMIAIIESMNSEDELKAIFESEQKGKNRKTVFQAIEAKMKALKNEKHDPDGKDNGGTGGLNSDDIGLNFNPDDVIKQSSDPNVNV